MSSTKVVTFSFAAAETVTLKYSPALCAHAFQPQSVLPGQNRNHRVCLWLGPMVLHVSTISVCYSLLTLLIFFFLPTDTRQYPVFVGHKPGRNTTQRHRLDVQLVMVMNRTLYVAARSVASCFSFLSYCFNRRKEKTRHILGSSLMDTLFLGLSCTQRELCSLLVLEILLEILLDDQLKFCYTCDLGLHASALL